MSEALDWRPGMAIEDLARRAEIIGRIRGFFDQRGFVEVQTPCLSRDVVVDRFIEPLPVPAAADQPMWLQTSPEFAMKRLLAAGARAIYQMGPVFRAGERGRSHNTEFTMLEWYRAGDDYRRGMDLLEEFAGELIVDAPAIRMTYRQLFQKFAGIDPFAGVEFEDLNRLLAEQVEPALQSIPSLIVHDWPADQAALARTRTDASGIQVAERFELYCHGTELANGYHELTDAEELLRRNQQVNRQRQAAGQVALPVDSRLLQAMQAGLPDSCGVALGVDRLVMLALNKPDIDQVMPFAGDRA